MNEKPNGPSAKFQDQTFAQLQRNSALSALQLPSYLPIECLGEGPLRGLQPQHRDASANGRFGPVKTGEAPSDKTACPATSPSDH